MLKEIIVMQSMRCPVVERIKCNSDNGLQLRNTVGYLFNFFLSHTLYYYGSDLRRGQVLGYEGQDVRWTIRAGYSGTCMPLCYKDLAIGVRYAPIVTQVALDGTWTTIAASAAKP